MQLLHRPEFASEVRWWVDAIHNALKDQLEEMTDRGLARTMSMMSCCSGSGLELWATRSLGIEVAPYICCDIDPKARQLCCKLHGNLAEHVFDGMACLRRSSFAGFCEKHGQYCVETSPRQYDLLVAGPSCRPYSCLRSDKKLPEQHPDFKCIFGAHDMPFAPTGEHDVEVEGDQGAIDREGSLLDVVRAHRPLGGIVENVLGFHQTQRAGFFAQQTPLQYLIEKLQEVKDDRGQQFYVAFQAFSLDSRHWLDITRGRTIREIQLCWSKVSAPK